jgi:hypothetical protein
MKSLLLILLLCATPCLASISLDVTSTSSASSVSSLSWSHTVGVGSNTILIVAAGGRNSVVGNATVSSVTYNGANLTKAVEKQESGDGNNSSVWYLVAPATGVHTVVVTYAGSCTSVGGAGISLFGVDQVSPIDATSPGSSFAGGSASATITTVAASTWIIDSYSASNTWSSWGAGQIDNAHSTAQGSSRAGPVTAGSNTMTLNLSGFAQGSYTAASFKPAAGAVKLCTLSLMGAGPC